MREVEGRGISISLRGNLESPKGDLEFTESDVGCRNPLGVIQNPLKGNRCHREGCRNPLIGNPEFTEEVQESDGKESGIHRGEIHDSRPGIWNLFLVCHKWDEMINHYR